MSTQPLISILILTYNQAEIVEEAVASAFAQTYQPLEVILLNDGSPDNTDAVAARLQKKYPSLVYHKLTNVGVCRASNQALALSTGEFVIRLDGDDRLPTTYVETLYNCLREQPDRVGFAYCGSHYFGAEEKVQSAPPFSVAKLIQENYIHVSALVRRSVLEQCGYFNPNMVWGFEDWDLWLKLVEHGYRGVYCPDTYLEYRQKLGGGRNKMATDRYRSMRHQIEENHLVLFRHPLNRWRVFRWRAVRRLKKYLGYDV